MMSKDVGSNDHAPNNWPDSELLQQNEKLG